MECSKAIDAGRAGASPSARKRRAERLHPTEALLLYPILEASTRGDRSPDPVPSAPPSHPSIGHAQRQFLNKQAALFASVAKKDAGGDLAQQVRLALALATQRNRAPQKCSAACG